MLSNAEKQISALMATLDILFTAGEKIAFSQNFTEKERAIGELELLERQRTEQLEYLKELQNKSGAMLGNIEGKPVKHRRWEVKGVFYRPI